MPEEEQHDGTQVPEPAAVWIQLHSRAKYIIHAPAFLQVGTFDVSLYVLFYFLSKFFLDS